MKIWQMTIKSNILAFVIIFHLSANSQKTYISEGKAQVRIESNMTIEQAKEKARELAMINAIEQVLGTYVEQNTDIMIREGRDNYNIIGTTRVKGDWIKTIGETYSEPKDLLEKRLSGTVPEYNISCIIKGEIREATPKANIEFATLNWPEIQCRQLDFYSGESLYLYFKSPIDGYLSIFLDDGERVYRLFPYSSMTGKDASAGLIEGDKDYVLFSKKRRDILFVPEEYEFYSTKQVVEYNNIYVVFSSDSYKKPILDDQKKNNIEGVEMILPKSLTQKEFQLWLANNRSLLTGFIDARIKISIKQKE